LRGKRSTALEKLQILKEKCDPNTLYRSTKLSRILGLSLPNTRRYLRKLVDLGFILEYRHGRFKYYRILTTTRIFFGKEVPTTVGLRSSHHEDKIKEVK